MHRSAPERREVERGECRCRRISENDRNTATCASCTSCCHAGPASMPPGSRRRQHLQVAGQPRRSCLVSCRDRMPATGTAKRSRVSAVSGPHFSLRFAARRPRRRPHVYCGLGGGSGVGGAVSKRRGRTDRVSASVVAAVEGGGGMRASVVSTIAEMCAVVRYSTPMRTRSFVDILLVDAGSLRDG